MVDTLHPQSCRIALLAGGKSGERDISLASGNGARAALEEAGFPVTMLDPANAEDLKALIDGNFDVAFLCVHGRYGEDGSLQGFLELIGLPYIGSDVLSSALAMNKAKAKLMYEQAGLPTPPSLSVFSGEAVSEQDIVDKVGEHSVVKAASEGSTIGIFMVEKRADLLPAIERAFEFDSEVLIEKYVAGREFTVAVIGNDDVSALPIIEIVPQDGFYDYEAKYTPGGSEHLCPAPLDAKATARMQDLAVKAHRALGCSGVSRTDFIMDEAGDCWILETNTIPGMTGTSLLPDAAKANGISFAELCRQLVSLALDRACKTPGQS